MGLFPPLVNAPFNPPLPSILESSLLLCLLPSKMTPLYYSAHLSNRLKSRKCFLLIWEASLHTAFDSADSQLPYGNSWPTGHLSNPEFCSGRLFRVIHRVYGSQILVFNVSSQPSSFVSFCCRFVFNDLIQYLRSASAYPPIPSSAYWILQS